MTSTSGIQELNESLGKASQESSALTEQQLELLSAVVTAGLVMALLPEITVAASIGVAALLAIGPVTAALALAAAVSLGSVYALDVLGLIHLTKEDQRLVKFTGRLFGNPFSIVLGAVGQYVDGDYGLETGVSAGGFVNFLYDTNDAIEAIMKSPTNILHDGFYASQLVKELSELSSASNGEHVWSGRHIWSEHLNSDSMTRDMLEKIARTSKPLTAKVTENPQPKPSQDNANAQKRIDRHVFDTPQNPPYSPQYRTTPVVPKPDPKPDPPKPDPKPKPKPDPPKPDPKPDLKPDPNPTLKYLMPDWLGGSDSSDSPPPVPTIPDKQKEQDDETKIEGLS
jgi:hypothetical protein